jgi:hypothetical protein
MRDSVLFLSISGGLGATSSAVFNSSVLCTGVDGVHIPPPPLLPPPPPPPLGIAVLFVTECAINLTALFSYVS